jgi:hypothetical protein
MPTTLDPATAVVLIDLQHGITARSIDESQVDRRPDAGSVGL